MKKFYFSILAFFTLSFISCQEDSMIEQSPELNKEQSVKIYTDSSDQELNGRTIHDYASNEHYWQENDSLSVFMRDGKNRLFYLVEGAGTQSGGFMGLIWSGTGDASSTNFPNNVAYYPYNKNLTATHLGNGEYSLSSTLPSKQIYGGDGTYAQFTYPMIGVTEDNTRINYQLKAVASAVVIHLRGNANTKISKIVLKANGHKIAGNFIVNASYNNVPRTNATEDAVDFITLDCKEPVQLNDETAIKFWITALPTTYNEGDLTVDIYDSNGGFMKDLNLSPYGSNTHELKRNTRKNFGRDEGKYIYYQAEDSFIEMLKKAKSGDVINYTLPGDITLTETAPINAGVTLNLDLDGHTITSDIAGNAWTLANNSVLNVKNGTLKNVEKDPMSSPALIRSKSGDHTPSNITLENVVIENNIKANSKNVSYTILSPSTGNVTLTKVTMRSTGHGIKFIGHARPQGSGLVINSGTYTAERNVLAQGSNGSLYGTIYNGYFKSINSDCISLSTEGTNTGIRIIDGYFSDNKFAYVEWTESGNSEYPYQAIDAGWKQTDENNYEIYNVRGLKWFRDQVNGGNDFSNQTVTLTIDLDLKNEIWEPIGTLNPKNYFKGTFDGGNKTISNLEVNVTDGAAGLFGAVQNCIAIKNVTVINANIKSNHYAGVIVGWLQENGSTRVPTVSNCVVEQATITVTPSNGDNGDKAGAIVGYAASETKIDECSASDVQITGYRDLGGIVGMANSTEKNGYVTISNNKVESITISYSAEGAYQTTPTTFGEIYGRGDANLSDNTINGVTINWPEEVCAFINGKGYLSINDAITAAVDNDVISVKEGTYKEILNVKGGKTFTIKPAEEDAIVKIAGIDHQTNTVNQASTVTFENLTIDNTLQNELNGWYTGTGKNLKVCVGIWGGNLTFNNCKFFVSGESQAETGVMTWWTGGNLATLTFKDCEFDGANNSARAMQIYGTVNLKVDGCTFKTKKDYSLKYVGTEGCTAEFSGNYVSNTENFVQLGSATYAGKDCIVKFSHNTLDSSVNLYKIDNEENQTIYVDNVNVYPGFTQEGNGNITVNSPIGLKKALGLAGVAGAGNTTITLCGNLDMANIEWTPIKVDGYNGADIVTLEGNNAVITGLKAPLFEGGFAGGSGIVIKNLTIANSTIVSNNTQGSGAFVECSDSQDVINLENCHLKNSSITGSRTGGLVGWTSGYNNTNDGAVKSYITIKNCSVQDCTITGSSVGGLNGHAGANPWTYTTIEDCTVTGCTLNSTDNGAWRVGVAVGTANVGEVIITNLTESGNTLMQDGKTAPTGNKRNYYGRFVPGTTGKLVIDGMQIVSTLIELQSALDNATTDMWLSLHADITGNVTITQKEGVNVVIDGNENKFTGIMTVFGNARQSGAESLLIQNVKFVAADGAGSCIVSPDRTVNNKYSYAHNVTVQNCTFTDPDGSVNCAAIRHDDGGDKNWTVKNCLVDDTMHSILQVNNVAGKLTMDDCTVLSKNGANLNSCTYVEMTECNFDVKGYAVRFGVNSGGNLGEEKSYSIKNSQLKSACDDGDAVIIFRKSAVDAVLTLTNTTLEGTTGISGNTEDTQIIRN